MRIPGQQMADSEQYLESGPHLVVLRLDNHFHRAR